MITVDITEEMKSKARHAQDEITKNLRSPTNYNGLNARNRFYTGSLGEQAFEKVLQDHNKTFDYKPRFDGIPDKGDFILRNHQGETIKVDVKTNGSKAHTHLVVSLKQLQRYHYDMYLGVRLNDSIAEVFGYCSKRELHPVEFTLIGSMGCPLENLYSIEELMKGII